MDLVERMLKGDLQALTRLITLVENQSSKLIEVMPKIYRHTGHARVIGITGPPGAGKSTLGDHLMTHVRKKKKTVAVLAIDPSSPFSGGAVLGDRIRMQSHASDPGVFIRSVGSRGSFGGLSRATKEILRLFDAFGFDFIFIETVGVGQTELSVMEVAHSTVVILVPESGDTVQTMKAGLLEIADIFVVNKSDRPDSTAMQRQLVEMVSFETDHKKHWQVPVLKTQAHKGVGIKDLWDKIMDHQKSFEKNKNLLDERKAKERRGETIEILLNEIKKKLLEKIDTKEVESGKKDPYSAAIEMLRHINTLF